MDMRVHFDVACDAEVKHAWLERLESRLESEDSILSEVAEVMKSSWFFRRCLQA